MKKILLYISFALAAFFITACSYVNDEDMEVMVTSVTYHTISNNSRTIEWYKECIEKVSEDIATMQKEYAEGKGISITSLPDLPVKPILVGETANTYEFVGRMTYSEYSTNQTSAYESVDIQDVVHQYIIDCRKYAYYTLEYINAYILWTDYTIVF